MFDGDIFDCDGALTAEYLAARGYCCGNGCRNCPYEPRHGGPEVTTLAPLVVRPPEQDEAPD